MSSSHSLIFALLFILLGCKSFKEVVVQDKQKWNWEGLSLTEKVLIKENFPKSSSISLFITKENITQALQGFAGTKIRSTKQLRNWGVRIDEIDAHPNNGVFMVNLKSHILNPASHRKLRLDLEAQLNISAIKRNDTAIIIEYELLPRSINPHFKVLKYSFSSKLAARALADLTTIWLNSQEKLSFSAKMPDKIEASLSDFFPTDSVYKINTNKNITGSFVDLSYKVDDVSIRKYLCLHSPAFIKSGVWLSFDIKNEPTKCAEVPEQSPTVSGSQLSKINELTDQRIDRFVAENKLSKENNYLWINQEVVASIVNDLNNLAPENRNISIKSLSSGGYLTKESWNHGILGSGEFSARFVDNNSVRGNISIGKIQTGWLAGEGLKLSMALGANINTDINLHVDPNIGGGLGIKVGLNSAFNESVNGNINFSINEVDSHKMIVATPILECSNINIKALTDPALKTDIGWTKIPNFGVTYPFPLGNQPVTPFIILNSVPKVGKFERERYEVTSKDSIVINTPFEFINYSNKPVDINVDEGGVGVNFTTSISFNNESENLDKFKLIERALVQRYIANLEAENRKCKKGDLLVHAGSLEFGPNNEIIKFLGNSWNDIINGPGDKNEIVLVIDRVGNLINKNTPLDDVTYNFFRETTVFSGKVLGKNNEVTKALTNMTKEVDKFRKTPGKSIGDIPSNVFKEAKRALKKICKWC